MKRSGRKKSLLTEKGRQFGKKMKRKAIIKKQACIQIRNTKGWEQVALENSPRS